MLDKAQCNLLLGSYYLCTRNDTIFDDASWLQKWIGLISISVLFFYFLKIMQEEIEKIGFDKDKQMMLVEKLKQAELDKEVEFRIAVKKSDHLVFQILLFFIVKHSIAVTLFINFMQDITLKFK